MRIIGWLAMALGVVGFVACIGAAIGGWVVRPNIVQTVDDVVVAAGAALEKADTLAETVQVRLDDAGTKLTTARSAADAVATSPIVTGPAATAIRTAVDDFISGPYTQVMASATGLVERLLTVADVVERVDTAVPGIELPGVVTGGVQNLDERLTRIDTGVQALQTAIQSGVTSGEIAASVSTRLGEVESLVGNVSEALTGVRAEIADLQTRTAAAGDRLEGLITAGVTIGTVLFVYLALLHVLLFQQGRRWARSD